MEVKMKVSTRTRYAIRFLIELALHEDNGEDPKRMTTDEIAQNQGISEKYLEAIAAKLKKASFISSVRGVNGGYSLIKSPANICVGDLMRLMESTFFTIHCIEDYDPCCNNYPECVLVDFWNGLENVLANYVNSVTLEDIITSIKNKSDSSAII